MQMLIDFPSSSQTFYTPHELVIIAGPLVGSLLENAIELL